MSSFQVQVEHISAGCNCTYNSFELTEKFIIFGTQHSLSVYDLPVSKSYFIFVLFLFLRFILNSFVQFFVYDTIVRCFVCKILEIIFFKCVQYSQEEKVVKTYVAHTGRINCVRYLRDL